MILDVILNKSIYIGICKHEIFTFSKIFKSCHYFTKLRFAQVTQIISTLFDNDSANHGNLF